MVTNFLRLWCLFGIDISKGIWTLETSLLLLSEEKKVNKEVAIKDLEITVEE